MTKCEEVKCVCFNCVRNEFVCLNTPKPCIGADCDICIDGDMCVNYCNQHLTIEMIDDIIRAEREVMIYDKRRNENP